MNMTPSLKRKRLRALLNAPYALQAPGIYDGYGARLVQDAGFEACYMTGNGVSAALLGRPDVGLVDLTMIADHARRVASCIDIPLVCDADTGYGNVVNVRRTIAEFEAAGVAAIHIEDQVSPKRCAQLPGDRTVLDFSSAVGKIAAASAARSDSDFVLIARTDCVGAFGIDEAVRRTRAFAAEGADVVFVELKNNPDILRQIRYLKDNVQVPMVINMDTGGAVRQLRAAELKQAGIDLAIYPALARGVFGYAMTQALNHLNTHGNIENFAQTSMFSSAQYNAALGLEDIEQWESRFDKSL
ncbi:oxaloacetate decarboxylase [Orrella sp. NBD-18]|uniref:Oxaloacetate decarboxylase n=1 Tax=Sheuella amnicola TaxID=2707330 RepID=A0A6B2R9L5_9BURK|nr:oxaloacetate decarboxylase [Sheuella amnicola]NDY83965.1 oxaloacetate decarboxylase [Sheuella amnicola]